MITFIVKTDKVTFMEMLNIMLTELMKNLTQLTFLFYVLYTIYTHLGGVPNILDIINCN